ncbi:MAG: hydrogenase iron-sulfur subunit [Gammaproteobacteria bacterium]
MSTEEKTFEPEVVAFCCRHCAYSAADLAGGGRMNYPSSIKIVEMPCTGRANVLEILHALEKGADGVAVAGCLPGTCHYIMGNTLAKQRVDHVMELLKTIGLEEQRARMINISAAMGAQFVTEVTDFVETIKALGPSPLSGATSNTRKESPS